MFRFVCLVFKADWFVVYAVCTWFVVRGGGLCFASVCFSNSVVLKAVVYWFVYILLVMITVLLCFGFGHLRLDGFVLALVLGWCCSWFCWVCLLVGLFVMVGVFLCLVTCYGVCVVYLFCCLFVDCFGTSLLGWFVVLIVLFLFALLLVFCGDLLFGLWWCSLVVGLIVMLFLGWCLLLRFGLVVLCCSD